MENSVIGKVLVSAKIENLSDIYHSATGALSPDQMRSVEVTDALVDTGATTLSMPKRLLERLGLKPFRTRRALISAGLVDVRVYDAVRLTIQGRDCNIDVSELPDECPVLIGQLPLETLDFVVDPIGQRLIGNPAHGGEHMIEMY
jgi:predicted aspartyl protease